MASRKQKKVWRYVEEGSLLKLKSYLRKHRKDVDVNFTLGKRRRGVLHLVCSHGDDALLRLLLKHGADPLQRDRNGDTPLHLAARRALKYGKTDYDDLVVPLRKHCPAALSTPNNTGVTPQELLQRLSFKQNWNPGAHVLQRSDPEQEWREKLLGECQDEFFETFGQYDDDFLRDDEDEGDFADWAERIRKEYEAKQHARARTDRKRRRKKEEEEEERQRKELHARLEKEHKEYLERASRKKDETQRGKKRRYEERCDAVFLSSSSGASLGYDDIPWPAPRGSVDQMLAVILHGIDRSDTDTFRKFLRRQQALWHPDKFSQRCGGRLQDRDRQRITDTVTALSQELNKLAQSLR
ncbi:hypothetical protein KOW79_014236 [Hemibagrus wyckioides]|uniref:NF-kappa-B inhibitor-like protein 1 n=1 Tax=Hemibagrus wyckioides TaxID=337641 RepID=A0A9D3NL02_9TELE|nr:NF-kappa-B inhibitor-like protein 1 [Hemibagrus wyckioides]KAG7322890.1 hypothetical protein KOW79_014236 [Hemibagrus wyckioides]